MPPLLPQTFGPFYGMRYRVDPERRDVNYVLMAQDMLPSDPVKGGAYVRRCTDQSTTVKGSSATALQHMGVFRKRSGFKSVAVVDGEIYDCSGTTWSKEVTSANLATASVTLSTSARVFGVTYNDTYVFNDGVNQPFTWDGTSGASGLVPLTNAPSKCYGKPAVYFGKLFFIKNVASGSADRDTIVWSEENAANTGYEASGYNNVWKITQSNQGGLYALVGTNSGLYYFRRDSIGVIRGAVTPAFTTSGVHDDVSSIIGTTCPDVRWYEGYLYFFDDRGRPWRFPENGRLDPIWLELADLYTTPDTPGQGLVDGTSFDGANANVVAWPWYDGVVFAAYNSSLSRQPVSWLFSHRTGRCLCRVAPQITGAQSTTPTITGAFYDSTNNRTVVAFGVVVSSVAYAFVGPAVSGNFFDTTDGGSGVFVRSITVGPFGGVPDKVWRLESVSVMAALGATSSARTGTVGLSIGTSGSALSPYSGGTSLASKTFPATATYQTQARRTWGFNARQRWMTVTVADGGGFEGWGVYQVTVDGMPEDIEPDQP